MIKRLGNFERSQASSTMLASEGMTMILVIHEMSFARDVSDRVAFFHQGVMEEVGPAKEVMTSPKSAHLQKFLSNVR